MKQQSFANFWIIIASAFLLVGVILAAWFLTFQATEEDLLEGYTTNNFCLWRAQQSVSRAYLTI